MCNLAPRGETPRVKPFHRLLTRSPPPPLFRTGACRGLLCSASEHEGQVLVSDAQSSCVSQKLAGKPCVRGRKPLKEETGALFLRRGVVGTFHPPWRRWWVPGLLTPSAAGFVAGAFVGKMWAPRRGTGETSSWRGKPPPPRTCMSTRCGCWLRTRSVSTSQTSLRFQKRRCSASVYTSFKIVPSFETQLEGGLPGCQAV